MIKKTIIVTLVLFVAYNAFLAWVHPQAGTGQQQWQKNRILIEDYVDYHQGDSVVIVGNSLSARLYPSLLPNGFYNLALAGESIFDGINIVKQCAKKPKYLLVEANLFYKSPDPGLDEGVFSPMMLRLRKWLPSFREENQPANLLTPLLSNSTANAKPNQNATDSTIVNALLRQKMSDYQAKPDSATAMKNLAMLKSDIDAFEAEGVKVILYEMPTHCKLYTTPRYVWPEQKLINALPKDTYHWMPMPNCAAYTYTDGEHIDFPSSGKLVSWFLREMGGKWKVESDK